jgi:hypothetical protein
MKQRTAWQLVDQLQSRRFLKQCALNQPPTTEIVQKETVAFGPCQDAKLQ